MFKTLFGLITANPYVAALIGVGFLSIVGGGFYYVHHLNSTIDDLNKVHAADLKANGALATQKASLEGVVADQQNEIAKFQADSAAKDALIAAAQADKADIQNKYDKVLANANAAPDSDDGAVSPLLSNALSGLCLARPGATAAGCNH